MMEVSEAISEHVLKRLEDSFGKAVAMLIMMSATTSAKIPTTDLDVAEYKKLIDAICCDRRVVDMWGEAGVRQAREYWVSLV